MGDNTTIRRFGYSSTCEEVLSRVDVTGKVIMVTGTTSGIGIPTAESLAVAGAHVIVANRDSKRSQEQMERIRANTSTKGKMDFVQVDLSSLLSVQKAARKFEDMKLPLDVLILNAGVLAPLEKKTLDGFDMTWGVNHLGHFYLLRQLLPSIRERVVIVSSISHGHLVTRALSTGRFLDFTARPSRLTTEDKLKIVVPPIEFTPSTRMENYGVYASSKMCNVLTAMKVSRLEKGRISAYSLHPGMINTSIARNFSTKKDAFFNLAWRFLKDLNCGASTSVLCAVRPELQQATGNYWQDCRVNNRKLHRLAMDHALQDALWERSNKLIDDFEKGQNKK